MRVRFHPRVQQDVTEILTYYEGISPALADRFWEESETGVQCIQESPTRCHLDASGLRLLNMSRLPYHILFRIRHDTVKVVVVRHHRRRTSLGTRRG